jgi:hypothetical protein
MHDDAFGAALSVFPITYCSSPSHAIKDAMGIPGKFSYISPRFGRKRSMPAIQKTGCRGHWHFQHERCIGCIRMRRLLAILQFLCRKRVVVQKRATDPQRELGRRVDRPQLPLPGSSSSSRTKKRKKKKKKKKNLSKTT